MTSLHRRWATVGSMVTMSLAVMHLVVHPLGAQRAADNAPSLSAAQRGRAVVIASKPFGESYVLAEMFAQLLERRGIAVDRRLGLGATEVPRPSSGHGGAAGHQCQCQPEQSR